MTATPALAAVSITARYPGRPAVLDGLELSLGGGTRTALLGANGSGKTTLLRVLAGAHLPESGQVLRDGALLGRSRTAVREHRRRVQLVLQDPDDQLFSADVTQDVAFGPMNMGLTEEAVRQRVGEALELLGITHLAERPTHQLSYGERKRVATAGAVAMRPAVLLLDEPTAGLDPTGTEQMLTALARLHDIGTTVLLATHDVDLALRWADQAAVVCDGRVTQGPPEQVLGDRWLVARAALRMPWALDLATQLGLKARPRDLAAMVRALQEVAR